ncbi:amidophosphoribosyltransferase [Candidatus Daviesbacteria bacterium]|nr:amidophosphoribosyltransferase [Candidatus Daviesbacteria bacterium]
MSEKCAIFGVFGKGFEAARLTYFGLYALQHRGQESSGISSSDGQNIYIHKDTGLVVHVYNEQILDSLKGHLAIGHNRYSTSGGSTPEHNQPVQNQDNLVTLVHNGNLPTTKKLEEFLSSKNVDITNLNDSELMQRAIEYFLKQGESLEQALKKSFPLFTGAFSVLVMTKDKLAAIRDEYGIRPLSLGKLNGGFIFASETCAFDVIQAEFVRDVNPGEMVIVDDSGLKSQQIVNGKLNLDIFEMVYFARPDSMLMGKKVNEIRRNLGINLAKENKIEADVVIPVPDSAIPAALGFSKESKIPFDHGLIKNRYIHRTFIRPEQHLREQSVQMKLNPLPEVIKDKRVILIDDSIVRGTTLKKIVRMIRGAGAKEVHVLISSPPTKYPDFYGIDTPKQTELIAATMNEDEVRKKLDADSLHYLSLEGLISATGLSKDTFCTSCFTGEYPIDIGERKLEIKKV